MFGGGYLEIPQASEDVFLPWSPVLSRAGDKGHLFEETTCLGAYMFL